MNYIYVENTTVEIAKSIYVLYTSNVFVVTIYFTFLFYFVRTNLNGKTVHIILCPKSIYDHQKNKNKLS